MPRDIIKGRMTASHDEDLVVFVIGVRINRLFPVGRWFRIARSMLRMIAELQAKPDSGFLHSEGARGGRTLYLVQYWRSFEALEAYARDPDQSHWPAWREFNRLIGDDGTVGIFHETFLVQRGAFESVYVNMPPWGLGAASGTVPATGSRNSARERLKMQ